MNWNSATASATDNTSTGRTESMPSTVEGNVISYSANEPLLLCLPVAQHDSTASLPGKEKMHLGSIPTEEGPTKKKETLIQESPMTDEDITKQKATRANFSSRLQWPSIEKSNMPTKEASAIKKNVVVLESATQGADLPVEGPVIQKDDVPMPESPVQDFADMPTIEEPRKKRASGEEEATATPKQKLRGRVKQSKNYTKEERERLLKAMSDQSAMNANWEIVRQNFEATAPPGAPCRSTQSLKCQFREISASLDQNFHRRKQYTDEERTRLHKTVRDVRRTHKRADWEIVKQNFDAAAPPGATYRSAQALRKKFNDLKSWVPGEMPFTKTVKSVIEKRPVQETDLITSEDPVKTKDSGLIEESSARETDLTAEGDPTKEKANHSIEKSPAQEADRSTEKSKVKKRAIEGVGEEGGSSKKQHTSGLFVQYTEEEKERLLEAVANVKPTLSGTWEQVKQYFDENAPTDLASDAPTRSWISLRDIFSHIAVSMIMDAPAGKPLSINLTGKPLGAETLTNNSEPVDNDAVGHLPVYTDSVISRSNYIERRMKTVNSKVEMILSCVQSEEALDRDKQWML